MERVDEKRRLILEHALALADEHGLEAVSMRGVGRRLGLSSMALYPYVGNKDALLDGLVALLWAELAAVVPADGDWAQRLRAAARAGRALAAAHPGAYPLLLVRPAAAPATPWLAGPLTQAGLPAAEAARLDRLATSLVLGFAAAELTGRVAPAAREREFEADLDDLVAVVSRRAGRPAA